MVAIGHIWDSDQSGLTYGDWADERDAEDAFCAFCKDAGAFEVHRQVAGEPLWKRFTQAHQSVRADVLLLPLPALVSAGWGCGALVIEVKRSGEKIGHGCSQLIDYTNAVFFLPTGVAVVPAFGFLFPALKQHGRMASLMAHQRIGTAMIRYGKLELCCGECRVLTVGQSGEINVGATDFGRKLGSR